MDLGIFYILAVSSIATYGILMAGFFYFPYFTNYKNSLSYVSKIYYKINKTLAVACAGTLSNNSPSFKNVFFLAGRGVSSSQYFNISTTKRFFHTTKHGPAPCSNSNKNNKDNNSSTSIKI
jgi:hypothetical protein